jgi:puromycin-sensitive aminopeptidase
MVLPLIQLAHAGRILPIAHAGAVRPKGEEMNHETAGAQDPYRLPRHVVPTRYELRLEPDLGNATFTGRETVTVTVTQPTTTIVMNAVDLIKGRAPNRIDPFG